MKLATGLGYSAMAAAASVGILGLYVKMTLPPPASERLYDRDLVKTLALTGGLSQGGPADAPLLNVHAIVTGATSGLGREIASELYGLGATVIMASRSAKKTADVAATIKKEYPKSQGVLMFEKTVDTSSLDSVKSFVEWYTEKYSVSLHVLVNNAGIHYASAPVAAETQKLDMDTKSADGYDSAFVTNYLGHFLLTRLLIPSLNKTEKRGNWGACGECSVILSPARMEPCCTAQRGDARGSQIRHPHSHAPWAQLCEQQAAQAARQELQRRIFSKHPGMGLRAFSSCPAWASTSILPNNAGGNWVSRKALRPKAAILGVLGAILDTKKFNGGEFVAVFKNRIMHQWWAKPLMKLAAIGGQGPPDQHACHVYPSGPEPSLRILQRELQLEERRELAKNLYDWSTRATDKWALRRVFPQSHDLVMMLCDDYNEYTKYTLPITPLHAAI